VPEILSCSHCRKHSGEPGDSGDSVGSGEVRCLLVVWSVRMPPCTYNMSVEALGARTHQDEPSTTLYLTRHGESLNNLFGKIGGDADLSPRGEQYAGALANYVESLQLPDMQVWVTEYRRTQQTATFLPHPKVVVPELGEINAGEHDGLTYEEIADRFPVEFALRDQDKLRYRYPGGESYLDVVQRVKPLLKEMGRHSNVLIISHQATLRCLLSVLLGAPMEDLPYVQIPLHTVIKVTLDGLGSPVVSQERLPVECVDTHRAKPDNCNSTRGRDQACLTVPLHL